MFALFRPAPLLGEASEQRERKVAPSPSNLSA
jgi:hypothetical protein